MFRRVIAAAVVASIVTCSGLYASSAAPGDLDNDLIPDASDVDDDNDGILDTSEGYLCTSSAAAVFAQDFEGYAAGRVAPASPAGSVLPEEIDTDNWWSRAGGVVSDGSLNAASAFFLTSNFVGLPVGDVVRWAGESPGTDIDFLFVSKPFAVLPSTPYSVNIDTHTGSAPPSPALQLHISVDDGTTWLPAISLPDRPTFQTNTVDYTTGAETSLVIRVGNTTTGSLGNDGGINNVVVTTPNTTCVGTDTDGDAVPDHLDLDSDNDGVSDLAESSGDASPSTDPDRNGVIDGAEFVDSDNDGLADVVALGTTPVNSDASDAPDHLDLDSDNDGIPDAVEAHPTAGYTLAVNYVTASDADNDGVLSLFDSNANFGGSFHAPIDTDADGTPDFLDSDSDDDGLLDAVEAGPIASGPSFADPNGSVDDPSAVLANQRGDTTEVGYREVENTGPTAVADARYNAPIGSTVIIDVLANDSDADGGIDPASVEILDSTATDFGRTLVVPGQGTWRVEPLNGAISFTPLGAFAGTPTGIEYRASDHEGAYTAAASVQVTYAQHVTTTGLPTITSLGGSEPPPTSSPATTSPSPIRANAENSLPATGTLVAVKVWPGLALLIAGTVLVRTSRAAGSR